MDKTKFYGAAAAAALALTALPAMADVSVKISGRVGFLAGVVFGDNRNAQLDRDYDFVSGGRLQFDIKNVTDSGLEYGARVRFNNVDRKNNVTVDRTYVYVKGGFGTFTFGDAPYLAEDIGVVYAHQTLAGKLGIDTDWADGFRSPNATVGGTDAFYAVAPYQQFGGLNAKDTKVKYLSPSLSGLTFGVDFTPVVGGNGHAGNGGVNDLINDSTTMYENVIGAAADYTQTFDGTSVRVAATTNQGNGVSGNHDLQSYSLGGQLGFANGIWTSVNWTHFSSTFHSDTSIDSIVSDVSYTTGPWIGSLGYAYTTAQRGNGLKSSFTNGQDLKTNHSALATVIYNIAPGLDAFGELRYERNEFYQGKYFETSALTSGLVLVF
jgi:hypothetical protein